MRVDQARSNDEARGVDCLVGFDAEIGSDGADAAVHDEQVGLFVSVRGRVDDPALSDEDAGHGPSVAAGSASGLVNPRAGVYDGPQTIRGVAQLGSAFDWGSKGRRFKSCHPDSEHRRAHSSVG